ncbi:unnamed protein product [Litomosoides sigmodontis]|uniref:Uncharacterized protein n=1 Tax=Litomosoides sigmodontis TaxID=42156 RepID=A0A3P7KCX5_LITSI|nr:unnamed protein product [Litomosoides sigmodontis]
MMQPVDKALLFLSINNSIFCCRKFRFAERSVLITVCEISFTFSYGGFAKIDGFNASPKRFCYGLVSGRRKSDALTTTITVSCFYLLVPEKVLTVQLPSVFEGSEPKRVNKEEQFHAMGETDLRTGINRWFHRLTFNDSVKIRTKHRSYRYSSSNQRQCAISFEFMDAGNRKQFGLIIYPGAAEFTLACPPITYTHISFSKNDYEKYYEFVLLFSSVGIILFHYEKYYGTTVFCTDRITEITRVEHSTVDTVHIETVIEIQMEQSRIPGNWHLVKPIPVDHKIVIDYYHNGKSTVTVQLGDKNGIAALIVTIDYHKGILYTKRHRFDDDKIPCFNFGTYQQFIDPMLGRLEIGVFAYQYRISMKASKHEMKVEMVTCFVDGHHYSPYDIEQVIFDSTNNKTVFFAHYIEPD